MNSGWQCGNGAVASGHGVVYEVGFLGFLLHFRLIHCGIREHNISEIILIVKTIVFKQKYCKTNNI